MINSKAQLKYYLEQDKIALGEHRKRPRFGLDEIWKCQINMRKAEFYLNRNNILSSIFYSWYKIKFRRYCLKCGFTLALNVFGPGLSLAHRGCIVINGSVRIGFNCRIHEGVTIGVKNALSSNAPVIGNNVFIGSGAKILGNIKIADNCVIGANSVVINSIDEIGITVGGSPAKKISNNDSSRYISHAYNKGDTEIENRDINIS